MRPRHLTLAYRLYRHALLFPPPSFHYLLAKRNGCATRCVKLVYMVRLTDGGLVLSAPTHQLRQPLVEGEHDVHAYTEVRGRKQAPTSLAASFHDGVIAAVPACGAAHYWHSGGNAALHILYSGGRRGELYGYIGVNGRRPHVAFVEPQRHLVTALYSQCLYGMPHLAVAYQCYLHPCRC